MKKMNPLVKSKNNQIGSALVMGLILVLSVAVFIFLSKSKTKPVPTVVKSLTKPSRKIISKNDALFFLEALGHVQGKYFFEKEIWAQNINDLVADPELGLSKKTSEMVKKAFDENKGGSKDTVDYTLKFIKPNGPKEFAIVAYPNIHISNSPTFYLDQTLIVWRSGQEGVGQNITAQSEIKIREWKFVKDIN